MLFRGGVKVTAWRLDGADSLDPGNTAYVWVGAPSEIRTGLYSGSLKQQVTGRLFTSVLSAALPCSVPGRRARDLLTKQKQSPASFDLMRLDVVTPAETCSIEEDKVRHGSASGPA